MRQRAVDEGLGQSLGRLHGDPARAIAGRVRQDEIEEAFGLVRAVLIEEVESRLVGRRVVFGNDRGIVGGRGLDGEDVDASVEARGKGFLPLSCRNRAVCGARDCAREHRNERVAFECRL